MRLAFAFGCLVALAVNMQASQAQVSVKLGVLNDRSGQAADLAGQGSVVAAQMAAEDFNTPLRKLKVEIVAADHQYKPDIGSAIARKWFEVDGVDAIFDVPVSSVALAVSEIAREKNKLLILSGPGASELTGSKCSPNTVNFTYDTYALANGTGAAMTKAGNDSWFFVTADYAFGHALENDTSAAVRKAGGRVLGSVRHPIASPDLSSFLLQAQASKAKVIGLANAGGDTVNAIKQANEFGIVAGGQKIGGLLLFITDVHSLGLNVAQGLVLTEAFYWDLNEGTRAFSKRFAERNGGKMPTMIQAGVYASVLHYLKAVEAVQNKDAARVMAKMKELPTDDPIFGKGLIRQDGRKLHDMYLFEVKKPDEARGPWDYYKVLGTIPAEQAFRPMQEAGCPLVKP